MLRFFGPSAGRVRLVIAGLAALGAVSLFSSCYPDYGLTETDYDIVATKYSPTANFGALRTYAMPDTIIHIDGDSTTGTNKLLTRKYDQFILDQVARNMTAKGYTRVAVDTTKPPDMGVIVSASGTLYLQYNYWYGGYYGWYWGYYYPPYYGGYYTTYTTGTLYINIIDPKNPKSARQYPVIWYAAMNGLLNVTANPTTRLQEAIDQAFAQSPYLGAK
jgi:Domain of unknown function (DUF4136)